MWPEQAALKSTGGQYRETPAPDGCYIYDAENGVVFRNGKALPATEAVLDCGAGFKFLRVPDKSPGFAAWDLGAIKPGRYWLGLQVKSGDENDSQRQLEDWRSYQVWVNGALINCTAIQPPVYVASNLFAAEINSQGPLELRPGDRIALTAHTMRDALAGRLILYPQEPPRGPIGRLK